MKTFTIKHQFSASFLEHGWGNGYVIIPEGHPVHGMGYGFDTAHYGDSMVRWPDERSVLDECKRLVDQLEKI